MTNPNPESVIYMSKLAHVHHVSVAHLRKSRYLRDGWSSVHVAGTALPSILPTILQQRDKHEYPTTLRNLELSTHKIRPAPR